MDDRLSEWCNKFSTSAMANVEQHLKSLSFKTKEECAEYVTWLLSHDDQHRPFYYKEYNDGIPLKVSGI